MQAQSKEISFKGQSIYAGIDTHLKNWKVSIYLEHSTYKTFSQEPCAKTLANYLQKRFPEGSYYSAYEAGFCGFSVHHELTKYGISNIVVNPADIPTTDKERKQKEDKRDSRKIARSLRSGELTGIYIPSKEGMEFKSLVRQRKTLVKDINRNKNRVKSLLYLYGIRIPVELWVSSRHWSSRYTEWLRTVKFDSAHGKNTLDMLIDLTLFHRQQLLTLNREFRSLAKDPVGGKLIRLLMSIPGVGLITAITLLAEIEDINRFKSIDQFCSFVGLVPSTGSSSDNEVTKGITPRSNRPLRNVIIESAWIAIRNDSTLALKYNELRKRMDGNKAIVRIAKQLLNRIRYVLKNEKEYVA
jgi:transposase